MSDIQNYLRPVMEEHPCGDNIAIQEVSFIDNLLEYSGMPDWSPDWKELSRLCDRLLKTCKHMKLAQAYGLVQLRSEGWGGLRDGLALMEGWLDKYWDSLYPALDTESTDPAEQIWRRMPIFDNYTAIGPGGIAYLKWINDAVLCDSSALGPITVRTARIIRGEEKAIEGREVAITQAELDAALREMAQQNQEKLQADIQALDESLLCLENLDKLLSGKVGAGKGPNFRPLEQTLKHVRGYLAPLLSAAEAGAGTQGTAGQAEESGATAGAADRKQARGFSGTITSTKEVEQAFEAICKYYRENEPSSPVPLILQRAKKLVNKNFMEIMNDLAPEAVSKVQMVTGETETTNQEIKT